MDKAYYAVPGESKQAFCIPRHAPQGVVPMPRKNPGGCICVEITGGVGVWQVDTMKVWIDNINEADKIMPRYIEDIWDVIGILNAPEFTQAAHANKKKIRAERPEG